MKKKSTVLRDSWSTVRTSERTPTHTKPWATARLSPAVGTTVLAGMEDRQVRGKQEETWQRWGPQQQEERQMLATASLEETTKLIRTHAASGGCDGIILLVEQGDIPASGGAATTTHLGRRRSKLCCGFRQRFSLRRQEVEVCQDGGANGQVHSQSVKAWTSPEEAPLSSNCL